MMVLPDWCQPIIHDALTRRKQQLKIRVSKMRTEAANGHPFGGKRYPELLLEKTTELASVISVLQEIEDYEYD